MRRTAKYFLSSMLYLSSISPLYAQLSTDPAPAEQAPAVRPIPVERVDMEMVNKIRQEGLDRSKVMETISYLTDVYGPRLTGSPQTKVAGEWTKNKLTEWGLQNAQLEPWGPFGRGWSLEGVTASLVKPNFAPIIAYPKAWAPSTPKTIRGVPVYLDVSKPEDLEKYRGKLSRAIVLISPPRKIEALFEAPAERTSDEQLLALANAEPPAARGPRGGGGGRGGQSSGGSAQGNNSTGQPNAGATPTAGGPSTSQPPAERPVDPRQQMQLQADKWQLAYDEGAAVVLEPGRGDGGTVFVASATMPRRAESARTAESGNPFSRGPRPWAPDAPAILPQAVLAAEHYNRLVRMLEKGEQPEVEIDIEARYHDEDYNSFNIIAEIPGTDLKDEIVMLGAHFDSWQSGTGATDNAIGCGVAMEAVRILQAIEAKPRRTIRIALWTGEEQGLLGSRAYVAQHFGSIATTPSPSAAATSAGSPAPAATTPAATAPADPSATPAAGATEAPPAQPEQRPERTRPTYLIKPEHEKLSAYFNLDNGTGKIRGIYLQGNESLRPVFRAWLAPFADLGASTVTASNTGGTDHQAFDGVGLPGFQFIQDPIEYDTRTHHSSMDVYERIQEDDARQASVIMATFVLMTANRDEKLTRKPLDGELVRVEHVTEPAPAAATTIDTTSTAKPEAEGAAPEAPAAEVPAPATAPVDKQ